jgi:hypothetical protein
MQIILLFGQGLLTLSRPSTRPTPASPTNPLLFKTLGRPFFTNTRTLGSFFFLLTKYKNAGGKNKFGEGESLGLECLDTVSWNTRHLVCSYHSTWIRKTQKCGQILLEMWSGCDSYCEGNSP